MIVDWAQVSGIVSLPRDCPVVEEQWWWGCGIKEELTNKNSSRFVRRRRGGV